jgi:cobalt-zinc-cadmium efflux system protein
VTDGAFGLPINDLHVWSITSGFVALSAHVICAGGQHDEAILKNARTVLENEFSIHHSTIQIDRDDTCDVADHVHA